MFSTVFDILRKVLQTYDGEVNPLFVKNAMQVQTSRRQKYFTGHFGLVKSNISLDRIKIAGPKNLSGILTNKSQISLVSTFVCSCKN